ncbi:MAG: hypothetical protein HY434_02615 [Candidatus Liptonbacteria bacterium]|nr:hypothetical protein [Candidatus Liptonbacteria bacterium]
MFKSFKKLTAPFASAVSYLSPLIVGAQSAPPPPITSVSGLQSFVCNVIVGWLFTFLVIAAVVFVLIAAFKYLTAAGDPEKVKGASHQLIYAAVAIVVALFARGVPLIVSSLFSTTVGGC